MMLQKMPYNVLKGWRHLCCRRLTPCTQWLAALCDCGSASCKYTAVADLNPSHELTATISPTACNLRLPNKHNKEYIFSPQKKWPCWLVVDPNGMRVCVCVCLLSAGPVDIFDAFSQDFWLDVWLVVDPKSVHVQMFSTELFAHLVPAFWLVVDAKGSCTYMPLPHQNNLGMVPGAVLRHNKVLNHRHTIDKAQELLVHTTHICNSTLRLS